jgi:hypothetical protein
MGQGMFVPISVVANFAKIKALTEDIHVLVAAMKASDQVVVDEATLSVRPNFQLKRNTLILRDIPSDASVDDVENLLSGEELPRPIFIRPDIGNNWFITFENEASALMMLEVVRGLTWEGNPIPVRLKSENLLKSVHEKEAQLEPNQEAVKADVKLPPGYIPSIPASIAETPISGSTSSTFSPVGAPVPPTANYFYPPSAMGPNGEFIYPFPPEYSSMPGGNPRFFHPGGYPHVMPYGSTNNGQWRPNRRPYNSGTVSNGYNYTHGNRYGNHPRVDQPPKENNDSNAEQVERLVNSAELAGSANRQPVSYNTQSAQRPRGNYSSQVSQGSSRHSNRGQRSNTYHGHGRRSSQQNHAPYNPDNFPALSPSPQPHNSNFAPSKAYSVVAAESASREMSPLMASSSSQAASTKKSFPSKKTFQPATSVTKKTLPSKSNMVQDEISLINDLLPSVEAMKVMESPLEQTSKTVSPTSKTFSYAEALRKATTTKKEETSSNGLASSKEIRA